MRGFFAIDLPTEIKQEMGGLIALMRNTIDKNAVRWSLPKNLHVTLQFLADIRPENSHNILKQVGTRIKKLPGFELQLSQLELFPSAKHPKFIACQTRPHETLAALSNKIGQGIIAANHPIEKRVFRGHLTLGKLLQPTNPLEWEGAILLPEPIKFLVSEITFFSSQPMPTGSNYSPLARLPLSL